VDQNTILTLSGLMRVGPERRIEVLHSEVRRLGFVIFESGDFNLNLIGIRKLPGATDAFDDYLFCTYRVNGSWHHKFWPITTDPGLYYLQNPMRVEGTAILCPGQYRRCWTVGLHKGEYEALVQRKPGVFRNWRDRNRDGSADRAGQVYTDGAGINCHRAGSHSVKVGRWSAACQVHAEQHGFNEMMDLVHQQIRTGQGDSFSYTLIELSG
jgi:hypothetical protein